MNKCGRLVEPYDWPLVKNLLNSYWVGIRSAQVGTTQQDLTGLSLMKHIYACIFPQTHS